MSKYEPDLSREFLDKENEERIFLKKVLERLKGYACGEHKQLEKMILNRMRAKK